LEDRPPGAMGWADWEGWEVRDRHPLREGAWGTGGTAGPEDSADGDVVPGVTDGGMPA